MKKTFLTIGLSALITPGITAEENKTEMNGNPFFTMYTTPHAVPPFDEIRIEHYKPAFLKGMEDHKKEIDAIVNNPATPDFENTIAALDHSGSLLRKVSSVFFGQNSANTSEEMQALNMEISPLTSAHYDDISLTGNSSTKSNPYTNAATTRFSTRNNGNCWMKHTRIS